MPRQSASRDLLSSAYLNRFLISISVVTALLVPLYLTSAQSLSWLATFYFQQNGFREVSVRVGKPGLGRIQVNQLSLNTGPMVIDATDLQVDFNWYLLMGRVQSVLVNRLSIQQDQLNESGSARSPAMADLSSYWSRLPLDVVKVNDLVIVVGQPDLRIEGRAQLDSEQATLGLELRSNLLAGKYEVSTVLERTGKFDIALGILGEPRLLQVSANPDADGGQIKITGSLDVSSKANLFLPQLLAQQAFLSRELVAKFASVVDDISVKADFEGNIPWSVGDGAGGILQSQQLALQLEADLDMTSILPDIGASRVRGPILIGVQDGQLDISSAGIAINIPSVTVTEATYRTSPLSEAKLRFDLHIGLDDLSNDVASLLAGNSLLEWNVNLAADSDLALAQVIASSGRVLLSKQRGQPVDQMSAHSRLTFALQATPVDSVFKHAVVSGELDFRVEADAFALTSSGVSFKVSELNYEGVPYSFDWAKPAELQFDLSASRDVLFKFFTGFGSAHLTPQFMSQLMAQLIGETKASGTVNLDASVSSDHPDAVLAFGLVSTKLGFNLGNGQLNLDLPEDSAFELALASIDVGLTARKPALITWDHTAKSVLMANTEWTVGVPEVNILGQRVAFRNAQLDLNKVYFQNARFALKGRAKARSSGRAVPLVFDAIGDINIEAADFSIEVDHQVKQPLLKTELSGWRSPFDLDAGALKLALTGKAKRQGNTVVVDGAGELTIVGGFAHQEKIKMTGLSAAFPFVVIGSNVQVLPGTLVINALDAGVPVHNIQLSMHTNFTEVFVSSLHADALGAAVQTTDFIYNLDQQSAQFEVQVTQLPVAGLLLLEGEDIRGDGILDGNLSVVLSSAGTAITEGKLISRAPGGSLAYLGNLPETNPGLSLAIKALRNFVYREMDIDVNLLPEGDLNLLVKLQGYSPDVEKGRPINFNLNVSENLPALIESLQASETFSERIQQRLSN
ncbi:MAG: hypothetical protein ACI8W1_000707 [Candidatus Azotimanducaceae bacterium]